jgi:hypothetical protein
MAFTTATANKILDKILKNADFTPATALYVSLHIGDPGDAGANEVTGGSYARQPIAFGTVAAKGCSNSADINFTLMPTATITHIGIWSASTAGTFWWGGPLGANKTVGAGDTFKLAAAAVTVTLT